MIVTFYSYKGGVGRSMALINVAELLADRGYRVTICDWDLEAPGLERYVAAVQMTGNVSYKEGGEASAVVKRYEAQPGLVDLLRGYKATMSAPESKPVSTFDPARYELRGDILLERPSSFAVPVEPPLGKQRTRGNVKLLTAGKRDGDSRAQFADFLQRFSWADFYERWAGASYLDFFRQDLEREADIVLIDSRTGVTEHGGVCTHHLADVVVLLTAPNYLNIEGSLWMAEGLARVQRRRKLYVLPVASRVDVTGEFNMLSEFRGLFQEKFRSHVSETVSDPVKYLQDAQIIYKTVFSFVERVVVSEPSPDPEVSRAYLTITDALEEWRKKLGLPDGTGVASGTLPEESSTAATNYGLDPARYMFRYAPGDEVSARGVVAGLSSVGLSVWCDVRPGILRADEPWAAQFRSALPRSELYVLLRTRNTPTAWVEAELAFGRAWRAQSPSLRIAILDLDLGEVAEVAPDVVQLSATSAAVADLAQLRALAQRLATTHVNVLADAAWPPGFAAFDQAQASGFFERDLELFEILEAWERPRSGRWLQLEGEQGSGKSSLLRAGLLPAVRRGWLRRLGARVLVVDVSPGLSPLTDLLGALQRALPSLVRPVSDPSLSLDAERRDIGRLCSRVLRELPTDAQLLIALDPLERVLKSSTELRQLDEFLSQLLDDSRVFLVTAIAESALPALRELPGLARRMNTGGVRYRLRPLAAPALERALKLYAAAHPVGLSDNDITVLAKRLESPSWRGFLGLALRAVFGGRKGAVTGCASGAELLQRLLDEELALQPRAVAEAARTLLARLASDELGVLPRAQALARIPEAEAALQVLSVLGSRDRLLPAPVSQVGGDASVLALSVNPMALRLALGLELARREPQSPDSAKKKPSTVKKAGLSASALIGGLLLLGSQSQGQQLQDDLSGSHAKLGIVRAQLREARSSNVALQSENARLSQVRTIEPLADPRNVLPPVATPSEREQTLQRLLNQTWSSLIEARRRAEVLEDSLIAEHDKGIENLAKVAALTAQVRVLETQAAAKEVAMAACEKSEAAAGAKCDKRVASVQQSVDQCLANLKAVSAEPRDLKAPNPDAPKDQPKK